MTFAGFRTATVVAAVLGAMGMTQQAGPPRGPATTGRITGTVSVLPSLTSRRSGPQLYRAYGPGESPLGAPADTNELHNVVVYLLGPPGPEAGTVGPPASAGISQQHETFVPHVLAVLQGTTVAFTNDDPYFHNVFSLSSARSFDLGRHPQGTSRTVRFDKPGTVKVFCDIHANMSATVLVLTNSLFSKPNDDGRFAIESVPAGEYRIVAWHERTLRATRQIRVVPGETTVVDFNLPVNDARPGRP